MSEGVGAGAGAEGGGGGGGGGAAGAHLPPFSTFGEMADGEQRLVATDSRLLEPGWEYYERVGDTVSVMVSQAQYRPWESMPIAVNSKDALLRSGFSTSLDAYQSVTLQPLANKLPSFQSQFQTFPETSVIPETGLPSVTPVPVTVSPTPSASPSQLTQLTQLTAPSSPHLTTLAQVAPLSTTLTTLSPVSASTFHTLTAVNARGYPLVPGPPAQAYIDERHIQLYQPNIATINAFPTQNGLLHQNGTLLHQNGGLVQGVQTPAVVHVLKNEPHDKYTPNGLHHANFQNPMLGDNGYDKKSNGFGSASSPTRSDFRKKERRKMRANSSESDGSSMEVGAESSGQVAAVSSTAGFKSPLHGAPPLTQGPMDLDDISSEKQVAVAARYSDVTRNKTKHSAGYKSPGRIAGRVNKSLENCKHPTECSLKDIRILRISLARGEGQKRRRGARGGVRRRTSRKRESFAVIPPFIIPPAVFILGRVAEWPESLSSQR
ncbi:DNA N6-methyl adenine demethylase [Eumeta japonica]|uniref:DNA N6-methyl adenine demethylase n=1 Tax=Eumeta variegata TaxID=151549 RepID=A0A4C1T725_EUMVA|nr:DNA N6-methyl adenine demethylase [Eumeta japonica]